MAQRITFKEKWLDAEKSTFRESKDPSSGKVEYYLEALIVPFNKVSRNGVKYNEAKVKETHQMLVGKNLMHNHVIDGADVLPRGEWVRTWIGPEGMNGQAKVFNTSYNKEYIEWLKAASGPRVSLQVTGDAENTHDESVGSYYQEAFINDWLEASTVNVPGFDAAKASLAQTLCEAFGKKKEDMDVANSPELTGKKLSPVSPKEEAIDAGTKVELEHKPTFAWLKQYVKENNGEFPPDEEIASHIRDDHNNEFPGDVYYPALDKMEAELKGSKKESFFEALNKVRCHKESFGSYFYGLMNDVESALEEINKAGGEGFTMKKQEIDSRLNKIIGKINETLRIMKSSKKESFWESLNKVRRYHKEKTNPNIPAYDVGGWKLFDTSPIEISAAKALADKLLKSGEYSQAKVTGEFEEEGITYAYVRVKESMSEGLRKLFDK